MKKTKVKTLPGPLQAIPDKSEPKTEAASTDGCELDNSLIPEKTLTLIPLRAP